MWIRLIRNACNTNSVNRQQIFKIIFFCFILCFFLDKEKTRRECVCVCVSNGAEQNSQRKNKQKIIWRFFLDWIYGLCCRRRSMRSIVRPISLFPQTWHRVSSMHSNRNRFASRATIWKLNLVLSIPRYQKLCCCCLRRTNTPNQTLVYASYRDAGTCPWSNYSSWIPWSIHRYTCIHRTKLNYFPDRIYPRSIWWIRPHLHLNSNAWNRHSWRWSWAMLRMDLQFFCVTNKTECLGKVAKRLTEKGRLTDNPNLFVLAPWQVQVRLHLALQLAPFPSLGPLLGLVSFPFSAVVLWPVWLHRRRL